MNIPNKFTSLSDLDIKTLQKSKQIFADCYLTSTLHSLCGNLTGNKVLKNNITHNSSKTEYKIHFPGLKSEEKDVFVTKKEIDNLYLTDKYANKIEHNFTENPIQKAVEIAMNKLIKKYPNLKSLICRYAESVEDFEYNFPSRFMELFIGEKPIQLNEKTFRMSLSSYKKETLELLNKIENTNGEFNFVAGTGFKFKSKFDDWHCYTLENVDLGKDQITIYNTRECENITMDTKTFIKNFKYMTGFLNINK